jgi:two-component system response regulator
MDDDVLEILLVEDNPTDAELTMDALRERKLGNRLVWVKDGEEALDFLFGRGKYAGRQPLDQPRVVLLDLRLPKLDGIEVLHAMRADPRTQMTPVVVLTSSKEDKDVIESYRCGVNSYISKPVEFDAFVRVVGDLGMYWLVVNRPPKP